MFGGKCLYGFKLNNQAVVHIYVDYIIAYAKTIRIIYGQRFLPLNSKTSI